MMMQELICNLATQAAQAQPWILLRGRSLLCHSNSAKSGVCRARARPGLNPLLFLRIYVLGSCVGAEAGPEPSVPFVGRASDFHTHACSPRPGSLGTKLVENLRLRGTSSLPYQATMARQGDMLDTVQFKREVFNGRVPCLFFRCLGADFSISMLAISEGYHFARVPSLPHHG